MSAANAMPRNKLIGVRFTEEEIGVLDRLVAHFEETSPGVAFNHQLAIKAALAIVAREVGVAAPPAPRSRPKPRKSR
jgi:hypothetical protein